MQEISGGIITLIVIGILFVLFLLITIYASRYVKCGPNEVLVISGGGWRRITDEDGEVEKLGFDIKKGGGAFIWPFFQKCEKLSLELMTLDIKGENVYTMKGVPVTVDGVAQVKVNGDDVSIRTAAEQFLSKGMTRRGEGMTEMQNTALETMQGHLRAILGTLTVEDIYKERDAFSQEVQKVAAEDMANMGLRIVSFTIRDVHDEQNYLDSLGQKQLAVVKSEATIGEAEAKKDSTIGVAEAKQEGESAEYAAKTKIAEANRDYEVKLAEFEVDVKRKEQESELAYDVQKYKTTQQIGEEKVKVDVVEKEVMVEVQKQEVAIKEKDLEATIERQADADLSKTKMLAEAEKYKLKAEAEGKAAAVKVKAEADAEVIKAKGLAEAEVTKAKGFAEAEAMRLKAGAWQTYNQAAITQVLMDKLPEIAEAISAPLAKTERIVILGDGEGAGAARITADITSIISQLPPMIESLSGMDMQQIIEKIPEIDSLEKATIEPPEKREIVSEEEPAVVPEDEKKEIVE